VDLIVALHLEALFNTRHLESACNQSHRLADGKTALPHSREYDSLQLRHRLAAIQSLAACVQGLTIKTDMARTAMINERGYRST